MQERGLAHAGLAAVLGRPKVWVAAAVMGQHPFPRELAEKLVALLGLPPEAVPALEQIPMRGALDTAVPVDPTIYRLYEAIQVYGPALKALIRPALKALIHEEFGDGIMSAINFRMDVERVQHPGGDRAKIVFDGKFLPYQWD